MFSHVMKSCKGDRNYVNHILVLNYSPVDILNRILLNGFLNQTVVLMYFIYLYSVFNYEKYKTSILI